MLSFDRLLVLAILALSASVQSAPAGADPSNVSVHQENVRYVLHCTERPQEIVPTEGDFTLPTDLKLLERDNSEFVGWHGTNSVRSAPSYSKHDLLMCSKIHRTRQPSGRRKGTSKNRPRLTGGWTSSVSDRSLLRARAAPTLKSGLGCTSPTTRMCAYPLIEFVAPCTMHRTRARYCYTEH